MTMTVVLYNFDSSKDVRVVDSQNSYFFHVEKILCDFIADCFEVNNFDGNWRLVSNAFT